ncbi:MAG: hypothetical protein RIR33_2905 [Pseudomonadota bacterium]|jgi:hypothetical protein
MAATDGDGGIVVRTLALLAALPMAACATTSDATPVFAMIRDITANPDAWSERWVTVDGVLKVGEIRSWVLANSNADLGIYGPGALGIQMSEARSPIPESLDGKSVRVVGQVDISCVLANRAVEAAQAPNRIVYAGGFCHGSAAPHLNGARVQHVRSNQ